MLLLKPVLVLTACGLLTAGVLTRSFVAMHFFELKASALYLSAAHVAVDKAGDDDASPSTTALEVVARMQRNTSIIHGLV
jgi:hypothetical protein